MIRHAMIVVGLLLAATTARAADQAVLEKAWEALATAEGADGAEKFLRDGGAEAAKFMAAKLTSKPDAAAVAKLVAALDDTEFKKRQQAMDTLVAMGKSVLPLLPRDEDLAGQDELLLRLQALREKIGATPGLPAADEMRNKRALVILRAGKMERVAVLAEVAKNSPWPAVQADAAAALETIGRGELQAQFDLLEAAAIKTGKRDEAGNAALRKLAEQTGLKEDSWFQFHMARLEGIVDWRVEEKNLAKRLGPTLAAPDRAALVKIRLVNLNDPVGAEEALDASIPKEMADNVRLASLTDKNPVVVTAAQRKQLAAWYVKLAETAEPAGAPEMLERARGNLKAIPAADAATVQQILSLEEEIADLGAVEAGWISLLSPVDPEKHAMCGDWKKKGQELHLAAGSFSKISFPTVPNGSYKFKISVNRVAGEEGVFISIPVGASRANLNLGGWVNTCSGFEIIDGVEAVSQEDPKLVEHKPMTNNQWYHYEITVKLSGRGTVDVKVRENGNAKWEWEGMIADLTTHTYWKLSKPNNFGLGAHKSDVIFKGMQIKMSDGRVEVDRAMKVEKVKPPEMLEEEVGPMMPLDLN